VLFINNTSFKGSIRGHLGNTAGVILVDNTEWYSGTGRRWIIDHQLGCFQLQYIDQLLRPACCCM